MAYITIPEKVLFVVAALVYLAIAAVFWMAGLQYLGSENHVEAMMSGISLGVAMVMTAPVVIILYDIQPVVEFK